VIDEGIALVDGVTNGPVDGPRREVRKKRVIDPAVEQAMQQERDTSADRKPD
jgi:hypothetical protein